MTGQAAGARQVARPEAKAADLEWLQRFRDLHPEAMVLLKAFRPVAYTLAGPVRGSDLGDLRGKLEAMYPSAGGG